MAETIEVTLNVDEIIGDIEMDDLCEEVCSRGGVAAEDWEGLFKDDFTLITDILNAIRDEGETGEIVEWLKREGYRVTNADDDVVVIKRSKLESIVDHHIIDAMSHVTENSDEMKDVLLAAVNMLAANARKTAVKSSTMAFNGIIAELTEEK